MSAPSLVALCATVLLIVCVSIYQYLVERDELARTRCRKIIQHLYSSRGCGGDRYALKLFEEGMTIFTNSRVNFSHLGLLPGDNFTTAAYDAFCEYMTGWRRQHEQLEEDVLELKTEDTDRFVYLSRVAQLGSALQKSQIELEILEKEASRFYVVWLQPKDGTIGHNPDMEISTT